MNKVYVVINKIYDEYTDNTDFKMEVFKDLESANAYFTAQKNNIAKELISLTEPYSEEPLTLKDLLDMCQEDGLRTEEHSDDRHYLLSIEEWGSFCIDIYEKDIIECYKI